ncbi:hypothetical protein [uncultured Clostridium sp.]|uniref:hypothetical protein n=1 Tax=uncultured Clostridium sp. TaxID=59620 RepID=UPI0026343845|nr:hypothetical protein [uncultured Clostridium sp.]
MITFKITDDYLSSLKKILLNLFFSKVKQYKSRFAFFLVFFIFSFAFLFQNPYSLFAEYLFSLAIGCTIILIGLSLTLKKFIDTLSFYKYTASLNNLISETNYSADTLEENFLTYSYYIEADCLVFIHGFKKIYFKILDIKNIYEKNNLLIIHLKKTSAYIPLDAFSSTKEKEAFLTKLKLASSSAVENTISPDSTAVSTKTFYILSKGVFISYFIGCIEFISVPLILSLIFNDSLNNIFPNIVLIILIFIMLIKLSFEFKTLNLTSRFFKFGRKYYTITTDVEHIILTNAFETIYLYKRLSNIKNLKHSSKLNYLSTFYIIGDSNFSI